MTDQEKIDVCRHSYYTREVMDYKCTLYGGLCDGCVFNIDDYDDIEGGYDDTF